MTWLQPHLLKDKRKLVLLLSLLVGAGFMLTSVVSYFVAKATIRASIVLNELPLTSDNIYSEIQKDLVRPIFISSMMASDTFLRDWVLHGEQDVDKITKYLKEVKERYGAFTSFFVSERSRIYYHASGVLKVVKEEEPRDVWYFRTRQLQAPYEINVDPDLANRDALTIFINYRALDYEGNFIGATGVGLTVDAVRKLIDDYQQRYDRSIYFVDLKGNFVVYGSRDHTPGGNIRNVPGLGAIAEQILKVRHGSFEYVRDGHRYLLNVRLVPELHWYLFVEKAEDEALTEIRRTLFLNLGISLAITLVVVALTHRVIGHYQRRLEEMATHDKLTGLANRQAFDVVAEHAIKAADRSGDPLSAMLIDIDFFKKINDTHGHVAGDVVIQGVAKVAKSCLRDSDILCRWGGEEYMVLLKGCDVTHARRLAEKLGQAVRETVFRHDDTDITVTVSTGITQYRPGESIDQLIQRADTALYEAKAAGRDRVCLA
ncbi:MAG: sensor domain-containing diguanylate cyclase [Methylophilaceae bacterium]|nr:sensor domain-containing diguanylate cyclase [Methylophilaceae bacterium]